MFDVVKSCGWVYSCENVCFVSERPSLLKIDKNGMLHCEDGPAIIYPDGWSIFADHGFSVPEKVVTNPKEFTLEELKKLNLNIVEIVMRKIGFDKFMAIDGTASNTWTDLFNKLSKEMLNA
jgi:hypothetical protein